MAGFGSFNVHEKIKDAPSTKFPSEKDVLLHGTMEVWIYEGKDLPNMDMIAKTWRHCLKLFDSIKARFGRLNKEHHHHHKIITSDPYVSIIVAGATVAQTRIIPNNQNPVWNEYFQVQLAHFAERVEFVVKDNDVLGAEVIGTVAIPAETVLKGQESNWFPVLNAYGKPPKPDSALKISVQFIPTETNPLYKDGIGAGPVYSGVPDTYFPLRKGGMVSLYQDAHVRDDSLPPIPLDYGRDFEHRKCWEEICHAILEAHQLVYITGWSIHHKVKLVRESTKPLPEGVPLTLGELLKYKSQEGVRVLLLVWDERTSHDNLLFRTEGFMQTHDEETKRFFKHSSVHCVLSPRYASSKLSWVKQWVVGTLYTHHQKSVIVDSQGPGSTRKLSAFIGGLDLCDGRYDTTQHRLFQDLQTDIFREDYHNPSFTTKVDAGGPRQPWHDLHCKIEGPAAYDVLTNFEQRWRKATKWHEFGERLKKISRWHDDSLIKIDRISWILSPKQDDPYGDPNLWVSKENNRENWHVQIFRSIDSGSVKGFPNCGKIFRPIDSGSGEGFHNHIIEKKNLVCRKNLVIDHSIHMAYVKAIRSAQHFIYIENQYFLGSSYNWLTYKSAGANNLIPMELALKVADKIRKKERFAVYIVIPMWPEGDPTSAAVQEILFWQKETMQMMYGIVANAIKKANLSEHPQDYLNFYCLGNREPNDETEQSPQNPPPENSPQGKAQKNRRFMIYVHAKGMIVDDEYVLIGSANINDRSLEGSRDTEIAMGSYQPYYTWAQQRRRPRGQIYGYRMSLWAEHLASVMKDFNYPESLNCVKTVNEIAESNWDKFAKDDVIKMKGHLLKYPVEINPDGKVGPLPGYENFPDVGGKILGTSSTLPDNLTT